MIVNQDQQLEAVDYIQQTFPGYSRVDNVAKSQIAFYGIQEANGFELLRLLRREFSLISRPAGQMARSGLCSPPPRRFLTKHCSWSSFTLTQSRLLAFSHLSHWSPSPNQRGTNLEPVLLDCQEDSCGSTGTGRLETVG